jgi:hypothetical protein
MAKAFRKQILRLETRQRVFDGLPIKNKGGRIRPGSMNAKKGTAEVAKFGRR